MPKLGFMELVRLLRHINHQSILQAYDCFMGLDNRSVVVFEWEQKQTFAGLIREGGKLDVSDPGVFSRSNMDVQPSLCTQVLGDYLLKVIWDHGTPLIIPESIQHLHLLCGVHRSTSKTKAASAGKR